MGNFPESLSQVILVGIVLAGRLGVAPPPGLPVRAVPLRASAGSEEGARTNNNSSNDNSSSNSNM